MPSATSALPDPLDLVLHIGSGKTGTSSIQYLLHQNRDYLAEEGVLYPRTPGRTRHTRFSLFTKPDSDLVRTLDWRQMRSSRPAAFRRNFEKRFLNEITESGLSRVLVSDEALYGSSREAMRRLSRFLDPVARTVRLVVYLRRQDDHAVSRYQQVVKVGETRRLVDWMRQLDHSKTYDYYVRLRTWEQLVEPTAFVVRRFERNSFVEGSLYHDFFDATAIAVRLNELVQGEPRNESLDAEAVEFLRIVNTLRRENPDAAAHLAANSVMVGTLAGESKGPTLTAPAAVLDPFMARWEESNQRVGREYLCQADGELFQLPRRTSNTTADQHLDPARLEHFLRTLEIPEQAHAPLRNLAEREATNR